MSFLREEKAGIRTLIALFCVLIPTLQGLRSTFKCSSSTRKSWNLNRAIPDFHLPPSPFPLQKIDCRTTKILREVLFFKNKEKPFRFLGLGLHWGSSIDCRESLAISAALLNGKSCFTFLNSEVIEIRITEIFFNECACVFRNLLSADLTRRKFSVQRIL